MNDKNSARELFAGNLKKIRREHKITQEELAEKIGVSPGTISNIERGLSFPMAETIDKLSSFFNLPVTEFFVSGQENFIPQSKIEQIYEVFKPYVDNLGIEKNGRNFSGIHNHSSRND